jgi:NAD(P)-dependent dehydrogenase (short-subunit alcohol dehydrogenase family)
MKTVVITGSTRGIGFALARAFLNKGCQVVVSGRKAESTQKAVGRLVSEFPARRAAGFACDVAHYEQVELLWQQSQQAFGQVDIWINNAGIANTQNPAWEVPANELQCVVETNILGTLYGTKAAMQGFLRQGHGALYNMEGMGAGGKKMHAKGLSIYGMSKAGLHFFNKVLVQEARIPGILTGTLQPGMVLTEMVTDQYKDRTEEWQKVKGLLGMIASPVDQVAEHLAGRILENQVHGAHLRYGSTWRILARFALAPFRKKSGGGSHDH